MTLTSWAIDSVRRDQPPKAGDVAAGRKPSEKRGPGNMNRRRQREQHRLIVDVEGRALAEDGAPTQSADKRPHHEDCKSAQNDAADRRHTTPRVALILPQTSEEIVLWNDSAAQNRNVMPTWLRANPSRS
jgi:hypothetical protein